ncbi:hypothetical protein F8M41_004462 [Gigaspora margarita]|uniref:Uncharacterized protein n=1 Tax=Gigaspora margarita TaxID=4874 RepID=A0A8H4A5F0_GIGMA|nr:hypothetical protein F8M41_004462 [Gigaspora margarita]
MGLQHKAVFLDKDNKKNSENNCEDRSNNESDEFIDDGTSNALKTQLSDDFTRADKDKFITRADKDEFNHLDKQLFTQR